MSVVFLRKRTKKISITAFIAIMKKLKFYKAYYQNVMQSILKHTMTKKVIGKIPGLPINLFVRTAFLDFRAYTRTISSVPSNQTPKKYSHVTDSIVPHALVITCTASGNNGATDNTNHSCSACHVVISSEPDVVCVNRYMSFNSHLI